MADTSPTAYDVLAYPGYAFEQTHPTGLALIAHLHGLDPARPETARVLELGCGSADNLIPMAFYNPGARFVGIDLSGEAIGRGLAVSGRMGLENIDLRHLDIMEVDASFGAFDYIIAHGVYSWVPPFVREKIMSIFRTNLAPQGVAFLSYNCFPGWRMHDIAREIMLHAVAGLTDPAETVRAAREALKRTVEASDEKSLYGTLLRHEALRVGEKPDSVLFHDDLNSGATAFHFRDVAGAAGRHGLQFMAETPYPTILRGNLAGAQAILDRYEAEEVVEREQQRDFLTGRSFRESLFCHAEHTLQRTLSKDVVKRYWLAANVSAAENGADPLGEGIAQFTFDAGVKLSLDHRLSKAALLRLGEAWPAALTFETILEDALRKLGPESQAIRANMAEEVEGLCTALFSLWVAGQIEMRLDPPVVEARPGERPKTFLLARNQAGSGLANNPRHQVVSLADPIVRRFVQLLDGTRTIDDLVAALKAEALEAPAAGEAAPEITREQVEQSLRTVTRLSLLAP